MQCKRRCAFCCGPGNRAYVVDSGNRTGRIQARPAPCERECKLYVVTHREPSPVEWLWFHLSPWGPGVVTSHTVYFGIVITSSEAWDTLWEPINICRAELNYRGPIAKLEVRYVAFVRLGLSVTGRAQLWHTYLVTLLSFVAQLYTPLDKDLIKVNHIMAKFMPVSTWLPCDLIGSVTFSIRVSRYPQPVLAECHAWWCGRQARAYGLCLADHLCTPKGKPMLDIVRRCFNILAPLVAWNKLARAGQGVLNGIRSMDSKLVTRFVRRGVAALSARDHVARLCGHHWQWDEGMMSLRTLAESGGSGYEKIIMLSCLRNGLITDRRARHWDPEWTGDGQARYQCGVCGQPASCTP